MIKLFLNIDKIRVTLYGDLHSIAIECNSCSEVYTVYTKSVQLKKTKNAKVCNQKVLNCITLENLFHLYSIDKRFILRNNNKKIPKYCHTIDRTIIVLCFLKARHQPSYLSFTCS